MARVLVCLERLRLSPRAIEREHELPAQALAQGMLAHELLELADERPVLTLLEVLLDPALETGKAKLLQPGDLSLREALVGELGEWRPAPQGERLPRLALREALEALEVEFVLRDAESIARHLRLQPLLPERLAQPGHVHL